MNRYSVQRVYFHHQIVLWAGLVFTMWKSTCGGWQGFLAFPFLLIFLVLAIDSITPSAGLCNGAIDFSEVKAKEFASYVKSRQDRKESNAGNRALSFAEGSRMNDRSISVTHSS